MKTKFELAIIFLCPLMFAQTILAQSYTVTQVAGGGLPAVPAPALNVPIASSSGAAVDAAGNFYVANFFLNVGRKGGQKRMHYGRNFRPALKFEV